MKLATEIMCVAAVFVTTLAVTVHASTFDGIMCGAGIVACAILTESRCRR